MKTLTLRLRSNLVYETEHSPHVAFSAIYDMSGKAQSLVPEKLGKVISFTFSLTSFTGAKRKVLKITKAHSLLPWCSLSLLTPHPDDPKSDGNIVISTSLGSWMYNQLIKEYLSKYLFSKLLQTLFCCDLEVTIYYAVETIVPFPEFDEMWTPDALRTVQQEYLNCPNEKYLCIASPKFKYIWAVYFDEIQQLADQFIKQKNYEGLPTERYSVRTLFQYINDTRERRLDFLEYEINRLINL